MRENSKNRRDIARELARKYTTMTHEELDVLENLLVPMKFAKGEIVLQAGDVSKHLYYIEKGLVRLFYYKNGKELTEYMAVEGSIVICIESLFNEEPSRLQIQTLEPTVLYAIPKKQLEVVASHHGNIQVLYSRILEEVLKRSQVYADLLRFETAQERYKRMCKLMPQLILRAPLLYVASFLQMTPETLSRVRSHMLAEESKP